MLRILHIINPGNFIKSPENNYKMSNNKFHRSESNKVLAGVCGGLATYFNLDPILVRIIFIALFIAGSLGFWIYLLLWLIAPKG